MYVGYQNNQHKNQQLLELIRECKQNLWLCIQYMQSKVSLYINNQPWKAKENEITYNITKNSLKHLGIKLIKTRQSL